MLGSNGRLALLAGWCPSPSGFTCPDQYGLQRSRWGDLSLRGTAAKYGGAVLGTAICITTLPDHLTSISYVQSSMLAGTRRSARSTPRPATKVPASRRSTSLRTQVRYFAAPMST